MNHSYEEIRKAALDILSGREECSIAPSQFISLQNAIAEVFARREGQMGGPFGGSIGRPLSESDSEIFLEIFWDLFRQSVITLGHDNSNPAFPWFRVSASGERMLAGQDAYFFHDVSSYVAVIRENIPSIDDTTLIYLKEAMQAFLSGCILSSTVMLGVSIEHSFLKLIETIESNPKHKAAFKNVGNERTILQKINKFRKNLEPLIKEMPQTLKEDLDTNLLGILSMIRNFRNESGHPSGKIISREQCYILLQLFIPCCKKIYDLIDHYNHIPTP